MLWDEAEAAIQAHIEAQWLAGAYASVPLVWENTLPDGVPGTFMAVTIEGVYADKGIYGGAGKRSSEEGGVVFFHAFVPSGTGKATASAMVVAMNTMLELQYVATGIYLEGGSPPSPADPGDINIPGAQPGGAFYRVSGSVPFILVGSR